MATNKPKNPRVKQTPNVSKAGNTPIVDESSAFNIEGNLISEENETVFASPNADLSNDSYTIDNEDGLFSDDVPRSSTVRYIERSDSTESIPGDDRMITVRIRNTIIDRVAGTVVTEPIWRETPNLNAIMRRASNATTRDICSKFFLDYTLTKVIPPLIAVNTIKPGDAVVLPSQLYAEIGKHVANPSAQHVLMEIVNAYLMKTGVIAKSGRFTTRMYYPFQQVTTTHLARDIAMQEVVRTLSTVNEVNLSSRKYSPASFAEEVAEALYPIGKAMLEVNELGGVIDDIIIGIRKNIDPELTGLSGNVDDNWANNPVVEELSHNYVFVDAALSLPAGTSVAPLANDGFRLSQWAPIILAALKVSPRYAIVGKNEVIRNMGLTKVRDLRNRPVSYVLHRSAKPEAVAQAVFSFPDARITNAVVVTATKERVADAVASAYGNTEGLGTTNAASLLHSFLTSAVESGFTSTKLGYHIDLGNYHSSSNHEIACLLAESIRIYVDSEGSIITSDKTTNNNWWYKIQTNEVDFPMGISGKLDRTTFITNSIGELFIAADEFEPAAALDPRPQLIAPIAFDSRIIGFDPKSLQDVNSRYSYKVTVNGTAIHGSFKTTDLGSMRANSLTSLVKPSFNEDVFDTVSSVFRVMDAELVRMNKSNAQGDGPSADVISYLSRQVARNLLRYAQNLAPGFRQEVHNGMIDRSVATMSPSDAFSMRAKLAQREFGGYADVSALILFLKMQGVLSTNWLDTLNGKDMVSVFFDYGTDRDSSKL